jgi:type II secretory pathway predicted ATPase ExeA
MYETHFGLSRRPFAESVSPDVYVELPSREAVLRRVRYALEQLQGPALVYGPPGSGKTLIGAMLARSWSNPTTHVTFPMLPAAEFVGWIADELEPGRPTMAIGLSSLSRSIRRLRHTLSAAAERGARPVLMIDEAHLIDDPATFEALKLLLNWNTAGTPDTALLLLADTEILLKLPTGLSDRLAARCLLGPLTDAETASYVLGRLATAGAAIPLFDSEALAALHLAADGLPRRLNRLADLALLIAYAQERPQPDVRMVQLAARELDPESLAA